MSRKRELSPREARDRFLARRQQRQTEKTVRSYRNRLTRFVHWAESEGIESMSELSGWDLDEYQAYREAQGVAPATLKGQLMALKQLLDYCVRIEVVDEEIADKLEIPKLTPEEETSDKNLASEEALSLLTFYRESHQFYATPEHTFLEVAWHTGARISGLRALDLGDFDPDQQSLEFHHRPPKTGLKNKKSGERVVGINATVVSVLQTYIARERFDKRDDDGREPLFSCRQGRPSDSTIRAWSYRGTQPCVYRDCPHGNERRSCEFTHRNHASKCPSSRSPHAIRTGSITWQLDVGIPIELVAERVNATPQTIRRYYDKADEQERFRLRRRELSTNLDIENDDNE
ncbi:tyrosine-type recombinase/integrase [Haloprofundus salilacus]|uniref:tyrosine-type recombinase/integrase n=1 Tax=Haloprofundus salilacus TaxID=2876190 RepID=UPI001CC9754F|nr:tyrosine-type recombinase/integrase [Haloprofundus salilacus]